METTVLRVLVIMTTVCSLSAKHVKNPKSWLDAQYHCRTYFTDLSPITNRQEESVFNKTAFKRGSGWIALYRDDSEKWRWSGGEYDPNLVLVDNTVTSLFFDCVFWTIEGQEVRSGYTQMNFFCLNLIVVADVKLTWEEALLHCRENHTDLTSLLSETEILLAQTQLQKVRITEPVWIGLRYLGDGWLWVNGDPLKYEAWTEGGDQDHLCPVQKRCGALTKEGWWENLDCQERLNFICH